MTQIYISGKITGLDHAEAFRNFNRAENMLRDHGLDAVNPMKKFSEQLGLSWREYMAEDIKVLVDCDAIYMLGNWRDSKGARLEHRIAIDLGLRVIYEQLIEGEDLAHFHRCGECDLGWETEHAAQTCCVVMQERPDNRYVRAL